MCVSACLPVLNVRQSAQRPVTHAFGGICRATATSWWICLLTAPLVTAVMLAEQQSNLYLRYTHFQLNRLSTSHFCSSFCVCCCADVCCCWVRVASHGRNVSLLSCLEANKGCLRFGTSGLLHLTFWQPSNESSGRNRVLNRTVLPTPRPVICPGLSGI